MTGTLGDSNLRRESILLVAAIGRTPLDVGFVIESWIPFRKGVLPLDRGQSSSLLEPADADRTSAQLPTSLVLVGGEESRGSLADMVGEGWCRSGCETLGASLGDSGTYTGTSSIHEHICCS